MRRWRRPMRISAPGTIAALVGAAAGSYILLAIGLGVGHHLGRIFVFVPGFVALLAIACGAGAMTRGLTQRAALFGMAAAGFGVLGVAWVWINFFALERGILHVIATVIAASAFAAPVM